LPIRRIDSLNLGGRAPGNNQFCKSSVSAADIDSSKTRARSQPVKKNLAGKPAPGAHHPLIGGSIVEADLWHGHRIMQGSGSFVDRRTRKLIVFVDLINIKMNSSAFEVLRAHT
jgi:hypothetical protein